MLNGQYDISVCWYYHFSRLLIFFQVTPLVVIIPRTYLLYYTLYLTLKYFYKGCCRLAHKILQSSVHQSTDIWIMTSDHSLVVLSGFINRMIKYKYSTYTPAYTLVQGAHRKTSSSNQNLCCESSCNLQYWSNWWTQWILLSRTAKSYSSCQTAK